PSPEGIGPQPETFARRSGRCGYQQGHPRPHPYVELHMASAFSFLRGASTPEALVARAAALGMRALALTDYMSLAGVVRFQAACAQYGIQPIVGPQPAVAEPPFRL